MYHPISLLRIARLNPPYLILPAILPAPDLLHHNCFPNKTAFDKVHHPRYPTPPYAPTNSVTGTTNNWALGARYRARTRSGAGSQGTILGLRSRTRERQMHKVLNGGRTRYARYYIMLKRATSIDLGGSMFEAWAGASVLNGAVRPGAGRRGTAFGGHVRSFSTVALRPTAKDRCPRRPPPSAKEKSDQAPLQFHSSLQERNDRGPPASFVPGLMNEMTGVHLKACSWRKEWNKWFPAWNVSCSEMFSSARHSTICTYFLRVLLSVDKINRGPTIDGNATLLTTPHFQHHLENFL